MADRKMEPLNLGSIARGALMELFEANAVKVAQNIADTSTDPEQPREIILRIKFKPNQDRVSCKVTSKAEVKLASIAAHHSLVYVNRDSSGHAYLFDEDPRQAMLFEPPPRQENLVDFKSIAGGEK